MSKNKNQIFSKIIIILILYQYILLTFFMENTPQQLANSACQTSQRFYHYIKTPLIEKQQKHQNYSPFLSTTHRPNITEIKNQKKTPSPGSYNIKSVFESNDSRDQLYDKCKVQLYNSRKIKENVMFKSTKERFQNKSNSISAKCGQYNYEEINKGKKLKISHNLSASRVQANQKIKQLLDNNRQPHYPSIPDPSAKFGYNVNGINLSKISKTDIQLQKQREAMKKYVKNLHENMSTSEFTSYNRNYFRGLNSISNSRIKEKIGEEIKMLDLSSRNQKQGQTKSKTANIVKKKIMKNSTIKCNSNKIKKLARQKLKCSENLGPGAYDYSAINNCGIHPQIEKKQQKFQFFNSTEERFPLNDKNMQQQVKKTHLKQKLIHQGHIPKENRQEAYANYEQKRSFAQIRKALKKPQNSYKKKENQKYVPGPGDYNPQQKLIKKTNSRCGTLEKAIRFQNGQLSSENKQNMNKNNEKKHQKLSPIVLQTSPSQNKAINPAIGKLNEKTQSQTNCNSMKLGAILKNLKGKKQKLQQNYRNYIKQAKKASQYSLSSWENRPLSQSQAHFSMKTEKKETIQNEKMQNN